MQSFMQRYLRSCLAFGCFRGLVIFTSVTYAHFAHASILPPNNLYLEDDMSRKDSNITEAQFNEITDAVAGRYRSVIASHGGILVTEKLWEVSEVNAKATQDITPNGTLWRVTTYGGLARRPEVTPDAFAMVVCHELGHHLGGFPFYHQTLLDWAATEGEADYFAVHYCAREMWAQEKEINSHARLFIDALPKEKCDATWTDPDDQNLCYRILLASESVARVLAATETHPPVISFATPSSNIAQITTEIHPPSQCRLDTFLSAALCSTPFDIDVIPGKDGVREYWNRESELDALRHSCFDYNRGDARPRCWFVPQVNTLLNLKNLQVTEVSGNSDGIYDPGEIFELNARIKNESLHSSYENLKIDATSGQGNLILLQNHSSVQNLDAGMEADQDQPFRFQINPHTACGSVLPLTITMSNESSSDKFSRTFTLGKEKTSPAYSTSPALPIPDGTQLGEPSNFIESPLVINDNTPFQHVDVSVNISHSFIGDLVIKLVDPYGQTYYVHNRAGGAHIDLITTVPLTAQGASIRGTWKLLIADTTYSDIGTINSWSLSFKSYECRPQ